MGAQAGIFAEVPAVGSYLTFTRHPDASPATVQALLAALAVDGAAMVVGIGHALARAVGATIPGLRTFPAVCGVGVAVPSTGGDLWIWLRGSDRGALLHRGRALVAALAPGFALVEAVDAFRYDTGRDLSGYEDGTENPTGADALDAAQVQGAGPGVDGGSFVAVQTWQHDLERLARMAPTAQDHVVGRRRVDNEELEDAPASAHVKRTAQEDFSPPAFVLRRSMPWSAGMESGLVFVAFGKSFDAFEALLNRMVGLEDGIVDGLFSFTRPVRGAYYFCPPVVDGRLDLRGLLSGA